MKYELIHTEESKGVRTQITMTIGEKEGKIYTDKKTMLESPYIYMKVDNCWFLHNVPCFSEAHGLRHGSHRCHVREHSSNMLPAML